MRGVPIAPALSTTSVVALARGERAPGPDADRLALLAGFQEDIVKQVVRLVRVGQPMAKVTPQLGLVGRPGGEQTGDGHGYLIQCCTGGRGPMLRRLSRRSLPSHASRHWPAGRRRPG